MSASALDRLLRSMVAEGAVTAAEALVGTTGAVLERAWAGWRRPEAAQPVEPGDRFDLASLTKPATASLALVLDAGGRLPLAEPLRSFWPGCHRSMASIRLADLLSHRAGLRPWYPLYHVAADAAGAARWLLGGAASGAPPGTYSDLGYLLWGMTAERVLGQRLGDLLRRGLGALAGGAPSGASPTGGAARRCVECRIDNQKERELAAGLGIEIGPQLPPRPGETQDGNARFLGGLAGHAGLFGSAHTVWALAREWLRPDRLLTAGAVAAALAIPGPYALGWARPQSWSGGGDLPADAIGHLGFTGGCVWAAPSRDRIGVLLSHRASSRAEADPWRRRFLRLLLQ